MPTVDDIIRRIFPFGTQPSTRTPSSAPSWEVVPLWPPDAFAVAASLAKWSECYTHSSVRGGVGLGRKHAAVTTDFGRKWAGDPGHPALRAWLGRVWTDIRSGSTLSVDDCGIDLPKLRPWARACLALLAAADEACVGIGYGGRSLTARVADEVAAAHDYSTIGWMVDPREACVQPKGRTPLVGCNLRSLSLHVALLPPQTMVNAMHLDPGKATRRTRFGVLLVPFPYKVPVRDFRGTTVRHQNWGRLSIDCSWGRNPSPRDLSRFVGELVDQARAEGGRSDVVVLPELAISEPQRAKLWQALRRKGVYMLVAGVHGKSGVTQQNRAMGIMRGSRQDITWTQAKHHRWRIEGWQIRNYGLPLRADRPWWEDIDVKKRTAIAVRFSEGATVACLVCEDLARVEPVQPVLREMGPSLIVALLMDGPQRKDRWSAKSATVFADDPGSSVLTLSSLGLIRRHQECRDNHLGSASPPIGIWQEPDGQPREIPLAPDSHAVHFEFRIEDRREDTLDGRNDNGGAEVLRLASEQRQFPFLSISHPDPPDWAAPIYRCAT